MSFSCQLQVSPCADLLSAKSSDVSAHLNLSIMSSDKLSLQSCKSSVTSTSCKTLWLQPFCWSRLSVGNWATTVPSSKPLEGAHLGSKLPRQQGGAPPWQYAEVVVVQDWNAMAKAGSDFVVRCHLQGPSSMQRPADSRRFRPAGCQR